MEKSSVLKEKDKKSICISVVHPVISRIAGERIEDVNDPNHIFKKGDYPTSAQQSSIFAHLDNGGNTSAFRGTTVSQDEEISHLGSPRVSFYPIYGWGIFIPALKQTFEDHSADLVKSSQLAEELGLQEGENLSEIFSKEQEVAVARPIPPGNVQKIAKPPNVTQSTEVINPEFRDTRIITYDAIISEELYEELKSKGCLDIKNNFQPKK